MALAGRSYANLDKIVRPADGMTRVQLMSYVRLVLFVRRQNDKSKLSLQGLLISTN
jgi:hypothetical protein